MISGIVRLADRPVREVMTPRTEIDWIDVDATPEEIRAALLETPHSRIPVADGSVENIVGVIQTRDVLAALLDGRPIDLKRAVPQGAGHSRPDGRDGRARSAPQRGRAAGAGP